MAGGESPAGFRALILEDEYFVADDLKKLLVRHGALAVNMTASIDDALRQIGTVPFDLALVNLNIHGESAAGVADRLSDAGIPFVFVSGYDRTKIPQRFMRVANWGKPCDEGQIARDLQRLRAPADAVPPSKTV